MKDDYLTAVTDDTPQIAVTEVMDRLTERLKQTQTTTDTLKECKAAADAIGEIAKDAENPAALFDTALNASSDVARRGSTAKSQIVDPIESVQEEVLRDTANISLEHGFGLDRYIEECLDHVKVVTSTDATDNVLYRWVFDDQTVETQDGCHTDRRQFWKKIEANTEKQLLPDLASAQLVDDVDDSNEQKFRELSLGPEGRCWYYGYWEECITHVIQDRRKVVETIGERTQAIEGLFSLIERSKAVSDRSNAIKHDKIYVNDDELAVPGADVNKIVDEYSITTRGLQLELSARELTHPDLGGEKASEQFGNGETTIRMWRLDATKDATPEPREVVEDITGFGDPWGGEV